MEDPEDAPAPYRFSPLRFLGWYVLVFIAVETVFGVFIPPTLGVLDMLAGAIFPMLFAAMHEGATYARAERRVPSKAEVRRLVWPLWGWVVAFDLVMIGAFELVTPGLFFVVFAVGSSLAVVTVLTLLVLFGLELLVGRHFFARGARNQMTFYLKNRAAD